jgi:hypothetical protein
MIFSGRQTTAMISPRTGSNPSVTSPVIVGGRVSIFSTNSASLVLCADTTELPLTW